MSVQYNAVSVFIQIQRYCRCKDNVWASDRKIVQVHVCSHACILRVCERTSEYACMYVWNKAVRGMWRQISLSSLHGSPLHEHTYTQTLPFVFYQMQCICLQSRLWTFQPLCRLPFTVLFLLHHLLFSLDLACEKMEYRPSAQYRVGVLGNTVLCLRVTRLPFPSAKKRQICFCCINASSISYSEQVEKAEKAEVGSRAARLHYVPVFCKIIKKEGRSVHAVILQWPGRPQHWCRKWKMNSSTKRGFFFQENA